MPDYKIKKIKIKEGPLNSIGNITKGLGSKIMNATLSSMGSNQAQGRLELRKTADHIMSQFKNYIGHNPGVKPTLAVVQDFIARQYGPEVLQYVSNAGPAAEASTAPSAPDNNAPANAPDSDADVRTATTAAIHGDIANAQNRALGPADVRTATTAAIHGDIANAQNRALGPTPATATATPTPTPTPTASTHTPSPTHVPSPTHGNTTAAPVSPAKPMSAADPRYTSSQPKYKPISPAESNARRESHDYSMKMLMRIVEGTEVLVEDDAVLNRSQIDSIFLRLAQYHLNVGNVSFTQRQKADKSGRDNYDSYDSYGTANSGKKPTNVFSATPKSSALGSKSTFDAEIFKQQASAHNVDSTVVNFLLPMLTAGNTLDQISAALKSKQVNMSVESWMALTAAKV